MLMHIRIKSRPYENKKSKKAHLLAVFILGKGSNYTKSSTATLYFVMDGF